MTFKISKKERKELVDLLKERRKEKQTFKMIRRTYPNMPDWMINSEIAIRKFEGVL